MSKTSKVVAVVKSNRSRHPAGTPGGKGGEFAPTGKRKGSTFYAGSSTYKCISCGKTTRDTGNDEKGSDMCIDCYVDETMNNHIMDGGDASNAIDYFGDYGKKWLLKYRASEEN